MQKKKVKRESQGCGRETLEVIIATFVALLGDHSKDGNVGAGG